jgi:hypothetical protein
MGLQPGADALLEAHVAPFTEIAGDRRTGRLLGDVVRGIIGGESLVCTRIAAFSPRLAAGHASAQRIRRMLAGTTTKRAPLDPDEVVARLRTRGVEQLRGEAAIWVVFDGTDPRKPHAERMECLQQVLRLDRLGTVPGYPTLNVLGVGTGGRRRALAGRAVLAAAGRDGSRGDAPDLMAIRVEFAHVCLPACARGPSRASVHRTAWGAAALHATSAGGARR